MVLMHPLAVSFALLAVATHALPAGHDSPDAATGPTRTLSDDEQAQSRGGGHGSGKKATACSKHKLASDKLGDRPEQPSTPFGGAPHWGSGDDASLDHWFVEPGAPGGDKPATVLLPGAHWNHDRTDSDHIRPSRSKTQYYMPEGASNNDPHTFGWVAADFNDNVIMLDYSSLYTWSYTSGQLAITFENEAAFEIARTTWHQQMIAAFYDGSCGEAMNCYFICNKISFDESSRSCAISTTPANFKDVCSYYTLEWGQFKPGNRPSPAKPNKPTSTTTSSQSGTPTAFVGNISLGFDPDDVDCTAPVDTVYGLPTACFGPYFDDDLDETYGYTTLDNSDFGAFANQLPNIWYDGLGAFDEEDYADDEVALGFAKRGLLSYFGIPDPVEYIISKLPAVPGITAPYDIDLGSKSRKIRSPETRLTQDSPWGDQVLIKSFSSSSSNGNLNGNIDLYCVDCGAKGSVDVSGKIGVSVARGVDYVRADMDMNIAIALKLGLVGQATYKQKILQPLFVVPLTPINVGVASIGLQLKTGIDLDLNIAAQGQVLAGGTFQIPNGKASIEVTSATGSATGWNPSFQPTFEASGSIAATADFGVPIALNLGISALSYTAGAALVDRPAIVAKAQASAAANLNGAGFVSVDGCTGISAGISWKNEIYAQLSFGNFYGDPVRLYGPVGEELASRCIELPAAPESPNNKARREPHVGANPISLLSRQNSNDTVVTDRTALLLSNATTNSNPFEVPQSNDLSYELADGYYMSTLVDSTGTVQLYSCLTGNIHVYGTTENDAIAPEDCSALWTFYSDPEVPQGGNFTVADGFDSPFVYFPDEMAATGVSRIRLADTDTIPLRSEIIMWVLSAKDPPGDEITTPIYFPINQNKDIFYPVMCRYKPGVNGGNNGLGDLPNRVFLIKDLDEGIQMLLSEQIRYSITGGEVDQCYPLPLVDGARYGEDEENGGLFMYSD